jgi:cysteine desulfurase family protein
MIYLDNAATTQKKPPEVAQAVLAALNSFGNCGRGAYDSALDAARVIYDAREKLAKLFGCSQPERVCFTSNSTEALNIAIAGLFGPGDHVISTDLEHNSVLRPLYRLRDQGGEVSFVPADSNGGIDYADFEKLIRPNTKGIVCTHASNLIGNAVDIARVGALAHAHGLLFVVDASQTAGVFPIDMEKQNIDVLCFTGHKSLMGPQGTGGLCVAEGVEIRPWKVGGSGIMSYSETQPDAYPTRLEAGTLNGHSIAGLRASLEYLENTGVETIHAHEDALSRKFYEAVRVLPNVRVYGNFAQICRAPVVTLNIGDLDSAEVSDELGERFGIATRPGAHCAPRLHIALGTVDQGAVRFSWGWFNTEEETDAAIAAIQTLAKEDLEHA